MFRPARLLLASLLWLPPLPVHAGEAQGRLALEARMADPDAEPSQRMNAVCALAGFATSDSVPALIALVELDLRERNGFWACAIPILGQVADRRAVPLLKHIGSLNEDHLAGMDQMAVAALAAMASHEDAGYLEARAHWSPVRAEIMDALARIGSVTSINVLVSGLSDGEEPEIVAAATAGLTRIGGAALPALDEAASYPGGEMAERARRIARTIRRTSE